MKNILVKALIAIACCVGLLSTAFAQTNSNRDVKQDVKKGYLSFPESMAATPKNCSAGKHWVTTGTGLAHCVASDMTCPFAQHLVHDAVGNPSCVPNTCASNKELQGDGVSCACPASLSVWNGTSCVVAGAPQLTISPFTDGMYISYSTSNSGFAMTLFTVTNTGSALLTVNSVTMTIGNIFQNNCNATNLAPSGTCTFVAWFADSGSAEVNASGKLTVNSNAGNKSIRVKAYQEDRGR